MARTSGLLTFHEGLKHQNKPQGAAVIVSSTLVLREELRNLVSIQIVGRSEITLGLDPRAKMFAKHTSKPLGERNGEPLLRPVEQASGHQWFKRSL